MADQAPSPARIRRAWRAGLRPHSARIAAGVGLWLVGWLVAAPPELPAQTYNLAERGQALLGAIGTGEVVVARPEGLGGGELAGVHDYLVDVAGTAAQLWASLALLMLLAVVASAAVLARIGPIDARAAQGLNMKPVTSPLGTSVGLSALILLWAVVVLGGFIAGAARSIDTSPQGLGLLWRLVATRSVQSLGVGVVIVGLLEAYVGRRAQLRALEDHGAKGSSERPGGLRRQLR